MTIHRESDWAPVPWNRVTLDGGLWGERQRVNRERTLPAVYRQLKDTGRIDAFRLNWRPGQQPVPHQFWDSDVAKWLEAAAYSLGSHPAPALADLLLGWVVGAPLPALDDADADALRAERLRAVEQGNLDGVAHRTWRDRLLRRS